MNRIIINEQDLTTTGIQDMQLTDIAYVPGFAVLPDSDQNAAPPYTPALCTSVAQFETLFGKSPAYFNTDQSYPSSFNVDAVPSGNMFNANDPDPSYIYAKELIYAGIPVVYERMNVYGVPADAPSAEEYDVTVEHMYQILSETFVASKIGYGNTTIPNTTVSVDATTFMERYPAPGKTEFEYKDTEITTVNASTTISGGEVQVDNTSFETAYPDVGTYIFTYINLYALSDSSNTDVKDTNDETVQLTVDVQTFTSSELFIGSGIGTYTFTYITDGTPGWVISGDTDVPVDLDELGIALVPGSGYELNPVADNTITVIIDDNLQWVYEQEAVNLVNIGVSITAGNPEVNNTITVIVGTTTVSAWVDNSGSVVELENIGITLTGSTDPTDGNTITITTYTVDPALLDKGQYSIKYLTTGGYPTFEYSGKSISQTMATLCKNRGDCIALIDHTNNPNRSLIGIDSVYQQALNQDLMLSDDSSSFAAMFTPWGTYSLVGRYTINDTAFDYISLPPSFAYLITLANSIQVNPNWLAVAGATRGKVVNLREIDLNQVLTNSIADSYQSEKATSINPITNIRPYGQCIWGNRTMVDNSKKGGTTALSFLNLRNLVSDIKKQLFTSCQALMFEQNTSILWVKFLSNITPLLDKMVSGSGISGYKVLKGSPSDKAKIAATVIIYPIYAVEQFEITVYLTDNELAVEEAGIA